MVWVFNFYFLIKEERRVKKTNLKKYKTKTHRKNGIKNKKIKEKRTRFY